MGDGKGRGAVRDLVGRDRQIGQRLARRCWRQAGLGGRNRVRVWQGLCRRVWRQGLRRLGQVFGQRVGYRVGTIRRTRSLYRFGIGPRPRIAPQNPHRILIAVHLFARCQNLIRDRGQAEPRLCLKAATVRHRHKGQRVEPMGMGKALGLGQGFARDDGDGHLVALAPPVEHQVRHGIGRAPLQRGRDLTPALGRVRPRCANGQIFDLVVRDDQLGRHPPRRQAQGGGSQKCQRLFHVRAVKRGLADHNPAPRGAVQHSDGAVAKI